MINSVNITIPDECWAENEAGDERLLFRGSSKNDPFTVNGVPMHVEAWRVEREGGDENGMQIHPYADEDMQAMWKIFSNGDGDFQTTKIHGKDYVIFITPYIS